ARTLIPPKPSFGTKPFTRRPKSPRDWTWHWGWSKKITVHVGAAGRTQSRALLTQARRPIAIQRRAFPAIDRPQAVARTGVMGARQLRQTAHCPRSGPAGGDESAQFRASLHQGNEDHAREICRTP